MAAYSGLEELQTLIGDAPPMRRCRKSGMVAVGLGLAAAAAVYASGGAAPSRTNFAGLQGKADADLAIPMSLIVEGDLGEFIQGDSLPQEAHPGRLGFSLAEAAKALFQSVVEKSRIDKELTLEELNAFKYRFVAGMMGMEDNGQGVKENFVERARKHIAGAKPVMTQALAVAVNARQTRFQVAMQDWLLDESQDTLQSRLIKVPFTVSETNKWRLSNGSLASRELDINKWNLKTLPISFDSRESWPACAKVIGNPHNQGRCGSCWVFGAMGPLDSRMCIKTNGKYQGSLSRGFGASCTEQPADHDGCQGGWPHYVFEYIEANPGIPSEGCVPYFAGTEYANHWDQSMPAPKCPAACDSSYHHDISQDFRKPSGVGNYQMVQLPGTDGINQLKQALLSGGPVSYVLYANNEFMAYKGGVFSSGCEWFRTHMPNHAVQSIGFGNENDVDYILSLNSWGTGWGLDGAFKVANCVVFLYIIPGEITSLALPAELSDSQTA